MAPIDTLTRRSLTPADIPDLLALVVEAGWNQTEADWQRMMRLGAGLGLARPDGRVIASSVTLPYGGGIGWIGMVLVAGEARRQGLATHLMEHAVATLGDSGRTAGLDATPAGAEVYARMGFVGGMRLTRWQRGPSQMPASPASPPAMPPDTAPDRPVTEADRAWITTLDADAFGAARPDLIQALIRQEGPAWARPERGFLLSRAGRTAHQLGPLCAYDEAAALSLLEEAAADLSGPLLIDVPDAQQATGALLERLGFTPERGFQRMYHRTPDGPGEPTRLFAIAGPELG